MHPSDTEPFHKPVGELMQDLGRISKEDLAAALEYKRQRGIKLGQALVELNLATEADLSEALRTQGKVHCIQLTPGMVDPVVAGELGRELSQNLGALAINRIAGITTVAMSDPTDIYTVDELALHLNTPVLAVHAEHNKIQRCLDDVFAEVEDELAGLASYLEEADELDVRLSVGPRRSDEEDQHGHAEQPVMALVRRLVDSAVKAGASELHLETGSDAFRVRMRLDGGMLEHLSLPRSWASPTIAHFKSLAQLDGTLRALPQDGSFQVEVRGEHIDLRFATAPTGEGEDAVLHFAPRGARLALDQLGLDEASLDRMRDLATSGGGLILATGPRASGRGTTLHALLDEVRANDHKVVVIEGADAIALEGTTHIRVNPRLGLSYARCLQAALLQDPDVILVASLEDEACARAAVEAALDGRLVLARVNARGTSEAIARLLDLGVECYALAEALRGVVAQRLVRAVCPDCAEADTPSEALLERVGLRGEPGDHFARGSGCGECLGSGFRGRFGLFEVLPIQGASAQLLRWGVSTSELHEAAFESGLSTLAEDGWRKARAGHTTLNEVLRATSGVGR